MFDNTIKRAWGNNGLPYSEQKKVFSSVTKELESISNEIENATTEEDIDNIREKMADVRRESTLTWIIHTAHKICKNRKSCIILRTVNGNASYFDRNSP